MRITRNQLRLLISEALEIHHAPEEVYDYIDTFPEEYSNLDKTNITKDEAFSAGCSVCGSQARDDCDYKEDSSMVEPLLRAIAESPPEGLTAEDLRNMSMDAREDLRLQLAQAAAHVERAIRDALNRG